MTTSIAFAQDLLPLVEGGRKKITIRKGKRSYAEVLDVTDPDGLVMPYRVRVGEQFTIPARDIPERLIQADGFLDLQDMVDGMARFYPGFSRDTDCTVVLFELT